MSIEGVGRKKQMSHGLLDRDHETNHIYSDKISIRMLQLNQLGNVEDEANMPELYSYAQLFRAKTGRRSLCWLKKMQQL